MKTLITILLILSSHCLAYMQECEAVVFDLALTNLDHANLFKTPDGNYIIIGDQLSGPNTNKDIIVRKVSPDGSEIWTKYIGDTLDNVIKIAKQLTSGEFIAISMNSPKKSNLTSSSILKIDLQGNLVWSLNKKDTLLMDMAEETSGNINFCGFFRVYNRDQINYLYVLKIDSAGNVLNSQTGVFPFYTPNFEPKYNSGPKPFCISIDDQNNIHLGVFFGYNVFSAFGELGDLYWLKYTNNFSQSVIVKVSNTENEVDEPFKIFIRKNGNIDYWCKPIVPGYDATASLFLVFQLDPNGNLLNKKEYYDCGNNISDILLENDNSYLILGSHRFYRFNDQLILNSRSTFTNYSNVEGALTLIATNNVNQYTLFNFVNNKPALIHYSYFGDDCLTQICGRIYTDVNRNCILDSLDQIFIARLQSIPANCLSVYSDTLGNYSITGEYGINYLVVPMDNEIYESSCNNLNPDTFRVKYPVKKAYHDMAVFKKNACFLFYQSFQNYNPILSGGLSFTNFTMYNKVDTMLTNFELKLVRDPRLSLISASQSFTYSNDTLVFLIDTLKKLQTYQLQIVDSIPCNLTAGTSLCMDLFIRTKDPCADTSYFKHLNICPKTYTPSDGLLSTSQYLQMGRPCGLSQIAHRITNKSSTSLYNVLVDLNRDSRLINLYASHPYIDQSGTWKFTIDSIRSNETVDLVIIDSISCNAKIGDNYCYKIVSSHFNKCDQSNKTKKDSFCRKLSNSLDPNYIEARVNDKFYCYFKNQAVAHINYTIHFQNIGNDTAFQAKVYDTLNPAVFKLGSYMGTASSHSYTYRIINDSIIEFVFDNINLMSSAANEAKSKAYVSFNIQANIVPDSRGNYQYILNRAAIYFDRNDAVLTDWNQIGYCNFTISTKDNYPHNKTSGIYLFPNPARSKVFLGNYENLSENFKASLFTIHGKHIANFNKQELNAGMDVDRLENGSYILVAKDQHSIVAIPLIIVK